MSHEHAILSRGVTYSFFPYSPIKTNGSIISLYFANTDFFEIKIRLLYDKSQRRLLG